MLCSIRSIESLKDETGVKLAEVFEPRQDTRASTLRLTNIDDVNFARKPVVLKNYRDYQCSWPSVYSVELDRALVIDDGVVIYNGSIISETVPGAMRQMRSRHGSISPAGEDQWEVDVSQAIEDDTTAKFCLSRYGIEYYGHWLVELLPRLKVARDLGLLENSQILLPSNFSDDKGIWKTIRDSFGAINVSLDTIKKIPRGGLWVSGLKMISPMGAWGSIRPEVFETFSEILSRAKPGAIAAGSKLYLTRDDTGNRRIANETDVIAVLQNFGFEVVRSSTLDFMDQVAAFGSASMVCGPLGSALSNIVFSPQGMPVLALVPEKWDDLFFFDLACRRKQPWFEVRGGITEQKHKLYHRNDFQIDIKMLEEAMDAALTSQQ